MGNTDQRQFINEEEFKRYRKNYVKILKSDIIYYCSNTDTLRSKGKDLESISQLCRSSIFRLQMWKEMLRVGSTDGAKRWIDHYEKCLTYEKYDCDRSKNDLIDLINIYNVRV